MVVVRESDGAVFTESEACLELARALGGFWRLAVILRLIPRALRDAAYRTVSRYRRSLWRCGGSCGYPVRQQSRLVGITVKVHNCFLPVCRSP